MLPRYILLWFPLLLIAMANGALRDLTYKAYLGELSAHQVSTVIGIILFGIFGWLVPLKWKPATIKEAIAAGLLWLSMTVAFEFLFFHYVMGHPWSILLESYNIPGGRVWVLVLAWVAILPYLMFRVRAGKSAG